MCSKFDEIIVYNDFLGITRTRMMMKREEMWKQATNKKNDEELQNKTEKSREKQKIIEGIEEMKMI